MSDNCKKPDPRQDPYGGFGETRVGSAGRALPKLDIPPDLLKITSGTITKEEWEALNEVLPS